MITLREVVKENYDACIALEVSEEPKNYIASNMCTLAQSYIY